MSGQMNTRCSVEVERALGQGKESVRALPENVYAGCEKIANEPK